MLLESAMSHLYILADQHGGLCFLRIGTDPRLQQLWIVLGA